MGTHDAVNWPLFTWLRMPGFEVTLDVRLDGLACWLLALTVIVLLLVLSAWPKGKPKGWLWLACLGVLLADVAGNLGQLFFGWTLSAWASSELARRTVVQGPAFRPVWLVQRASDMALLGGFGLIWMNFESASMRFSAWTPEAIAALRPELVESIALCVLIGVIGRCAQLPLTVWLETEAGFAARTGNSMAKLSDEMVGVWNVPAGHQVAERLQADPQQHWHETVDESVPTTVMAWWLCAAFLPVGIGVLVRFEPLFAVASHTRLLMVAVGAFTLLMCSANAVAQNDWPRVLGQIAVGQCGLVLVALGIGTPEPVAAALNCFVWQCVAFAVLLVSERPRSRAVTLALLCCASGLWGRHVLMDLVWTHADQEMHPTDSGSLVFGATESRVWLLVVVLMSVAELLTSLALVRAWFLRRRERRDVESASSAAIWSSRGIVGLLIVGGAGFGWAFQTAHPPLLGLGPMLPLSAAGMVLAWWMYSKPSSLPEKVSAAMGPFARLSRNRFYWDDLYFLLVVHPAKVIGDWLSWFDERVLGNGVCVLRSRLAKSLGESAEPLTEGSAKIGTLTTLSSVAVLAWVLLWLRS
ncbi:MAG: NADH-quinone oxidoreductase subunit L [Planctomycetota bacterium]|nr:MAG: NADH-quinone oxidoreductase subunit L [Planctomycetota bacterium]